jgi:hypothetical protein
MAGIADLFAQAPVAAGVGRYPPNRGKLINEQGDNSFAVPSMPEMDPAYFHFNMQNTRAGMNNYPPNQTHVGPGGQMQYPPEVLKQMLLAKLLGGQ